MSPDRAAEIGAQALVWLAADENRLVAFLGNTGASPDDLRRQSRDPAFLGFVLDFLLSDEGMVRAFAADANLEPDQPMRARALLPGGDLPHWT